MFLITVSQILFSCGKSDNTGKNSKHKEKPNETTQVPNNSDESEKNIDKDLKKGNESLDNFNSNLFDKYCPSNVSIYTKCDFKNIKLLPYANKQEDSLNYKIDYTFENCNFDKLNLEFFSDSGISKIIAGNNIIELSGYSLNMRDAYFWDTNTNEYDSSCSLKINKVETSFSNFTKNKITNYINIIKEHKKFLENIQGFDYLLGKLKLNLKALDKSNYLNQVELIKAKISDAKNKLSTNKNFISVLEKLELNLSKINIEEIQKNNENSIKLIEDSLNTQNLKKTIHDYKVTVTNILNNAEKIPNFNKIEIQFYKNELNSL